MAGQPPRRDKIILAAQYVLINQSPKIRAATKWVAQFPPRRYVPLCTSADLGYDYSLETSVLAEAERRAKEAEMAAAEAAERAANERAKAAAAAAAAVAGTSPEGEAGPVDPDPADSPSTDAGATSPARAAACGTVVGELSSTNTRPHEKTGEESAEAYAATVGHGGQDSHGTVHPPGPTHPSSDGHASVAEHMPWFDPVPSRSHNGQAHDGVGELIETLLLSTPGLRAAPAGHSAMTPSISRHGGENPAATTREVLNTTPGMGAGLDLLLLDDGVPIQAQPQSRPSGLGGSTMARNSSTISLSEFDTLHHNSTPFDSATLNTINDKEELRRLLAPPPASVAATTIAEPHAHPDGAGVGDADGQTAVDPEAEGSGDDGAGSGLQLGPRLPHNDTGIRRASVDPHPRNGASGATPTTLKTTPPPVLLDSTGDGAADVVAVDTTADGKLDAVYLSRPAALVDPGVSSYPTRTFVAYDADGDGQLDRLVPPALGQPMWIDRGVVSFDATGDGVPNAIAYDRDGDGVVDTVSMKRPAAQVDASGDGLANSVAFDVTGNGYLDTVLPLPETAPYRRHSGWVLDAPTTEPEPLIEAGVPPPVAATSGGHRDAGTPDDSLEASLAQWLNGTGGAAADFTTTPARPSVEVAPTGSLYPQLETSSGTSPSTPPRPRSKHSPSSTEPGPSASESTGSDGGPSAESDQGSHFVQMGFGANAVGYAVEKLPGKDDTEILNFLLKLTALVEAGHPVERMRVVEVGPDSDLDKVKVTLDKVSQLEQMGFPASNAVEALATAKGNLEVAAAFLIQ